MTLKEFAEQNGANYQTMKTWLRRGKVSEVSPGEFHIVETCAKPEAVKTETSKPATVSDLLTPAICAGCAALKIEVEYLRHEQKDLGAGMDALERENESQWDALQKLTNRIQTLETALKNSNGQPVRAVGSIWGA